MCATADLTATIEGSLILQPVKEVSHDRGMIGPAACRFAEIVIAMEKPDPLPIPVAPRQTNEFGAESRDDDAQAALVVDQNIEESSVALLFAVGEFHPRRYGNKPRVCLDRKSTRLNSSHGYISYA